MEIRGEIQKILKSYGVKWNYKVKYKGFLRVTAKTQLRGKIHKILKSYVVKWNYGIKFRDFQELWGKMELWVEI